MPLPTVLVVDDYHETASLLAELLTLCGYEARSARSAAEALASVAADPPRVVAVDPHMPGGWELPAKLRAPRVVALTTPTERPSAYRAAGFAAVVDKGAELPVLLAALDGRAG